MSKAFNYGSIGGGSSKLNIDELYEKKRQRDLVQLEVFNRMLTTVHKRIKHVSRQSIKCQHCWYAVPDFILGVPKYDPGACIAFLLDKLKTNGFNVQYVHPNILYISWDHWIPSYVRAELKKQTGIEINEYGERIEPETNEDEDEMGGNSHNASKNSIGRNNSIGKPKKQYPSTKSYRPTNLIYDQNSIDRLGEKFG